MKVYLDYSATSPIKKEVREAIEPFLNEDFGNPSSIHTWGQRASFAVDSSREKVAKFLNADLKEVIFTSGGTEADNLAIIGLISNLKPKTSNLLPHIITSQFEHPAVLKTCKYFEKIGLAEVTYLKPSSEGLIEVSDVEKAIKENTALVTIMYVNNEIGTVQPIREIGKMIEKKNSLKLKAKSEKQIYFHTDAVQAGEYFSMDVDYLHVDMLSISGHKIGAPKGVGVLYVRRGTPIAPLVHGGSQEFGLRAGTENVIGLVSISKAVELLGPNFEERATQMIKVRDYFINRVLTEIPETFLNGSKEFRSPNNANFYFKYIEGESILLNLDLVGIGASSGSACASHALEPSHVIMSVYNDAERAHGSIRFTMGCETKKEEIDYVIENIKKIVKRLRVISPLAPKEYK